MSSVARFFSVVMTAIHCSICRDFQRSSAAFSREVGVAVPVPANVDDVHVGGEPESPRENGNRGGPDTFRGQDEVPVKRGGDEFFRTRSKGRRGTTQNLKK